LTQTQPSLATTQPPRGWHALLSSRTFIVLVIPALWALSYLPNLGTHDLIHEEGRRATPARAMLATGDYVVPTIYGDTYFNKPPGFFWVIAGFGHLLGGINAWACRLPSVLSLLWGVLIIRGFARRQLRRDTRVLAGLMLLASSIMADKGRLGEIDALLSALVFCCMSVWWDDYEEEGQALESWLWLGTFMAMAVLLKAPNGPVEFYLPIVAFLLWERQWKRLFSWGHLVALIMMVLPTALWVALAYLGSHWTLAEFAKLWFDQIGGDTVPGQAHALPIKRYAIFPLEVLAMLLPWAFATIPMMFPAVARRLNVDRTLWRYLVCCVGVMTLAFWAWPSSRPRHMMAVIYPACVLAAMFVTESCRQVIADNLTRMMANSAKIAAIVLAGLGIAGAVIAWMPHILAHGHGIQLLVNTSTGIASLVALAVCLAAAAWVWQTTARTPLPFAPLSLSVAIAITMLAGLFVYEVDLIPYLSQIDETRRGVTAITPYIDPNKKIFTTLTLGPSLDEPGRGDDFYNIQFYLGSRLKRFPGFNELKKHLATGESCTIIAFEGDAKQFQSRGLAVKTLATLPLKRTIEIDEVSAP
jgi:4-amino-4-deoxy-L-arabinose transferase-like glycosyltransferase